MVRKFEDAIKVSIRDYDNGRLLIPAKLGNEAVNHFKDSWRQQGFDDNHVVPWKPRKGQIRAFSVSKKSDSGRAILVKTGTLRRSFQMQAAFTKVVVTNDTPYGIFHNEGTKKLPKRQFMGESVTLNQKFGLAIMRFMKKAFK